ncbi:MAG TPA: hypothetical protein VGP07_26085 [Polyangia bacterium]|jgi:hypothetical protein
MIGCLILGTFGAMVVAKMVRHRMGWGCHGGAFRHQFHDQGPWGGGGWHGGGGWGHHHHGPGGEGWGEDLGGGGHERHGFGRHRHGFGRGRGFVVGAVLDRIGATPVQERTIRAAFEELREEAKQAGGGEVKQLRKDLATALRNPSFDEVLLGELFARHDRAIEEVRKSFVGFMAKTHDALDEEQRAHLAEMVEKGPRFWRSGFDW